MACSAACVAVHLLQTMGLRPAVRPPSRVHAHAPGQLCRCMLRACAGSAFSGKKNSSSTCAVSAVFESFMRARDRSPPLALPDAAHPLQSDLAKSQRRPRLLQRILCFPVDSPPKSAALLTGCVIEITFRSVLFQRHHLLLAPRSKSAVHPPPLNEASTSCLPRTSLRPLNDNMAFPTTSSDFASATCSWATLYSQGETVSGAPACVSFALTLALP